MRLGAKKLVFLLISCSVFIAGFAQNRKASSNGMAMAQQDATTIPYLLTLHERIVQASK
jgi:outer membrane lipoprotein-sorting protein